MIKKVIKNVLPPFGALLVHNYHVNAECGLSLLNQIHHEIYGDFRIEIPSLNFTLDIDEMKEVNAQRVKGLLGHPVFHEEDMVVTAVEENPGIAKVHGKISWACDEKNFNTYVKVSVEHPNGSGTSYFGDNLGLAYNQTYCAEGVVTNNAHYYAGLSFNGTDTVEKQLYLCTYNDIGRRYLACHDDSAQLMEKTGQDIVQRMNALQNKRSNETQPRNQTELHDDYREMLQGKQTLLNIHNLMDKNKCFELKSHFHDFLGKVHNMTQEFKKMVQNDMCGIKFYATEIGFDALDLITRHIPGWQKIIRLGSNPDICGVNVSVGPPNEGLIKYGKQVGCALASLPLVPQRASNWLQSNVCQPAQLQPKVIDWLQKLICDDVVQGMKEFVEKLYVCNSTQYEHDCSEQLAQQCNSTIM